jgi:hypothetical protein
MKKLFVITTLLMTLSSFACEQYEAQFGGTINEVTQTDDGCLVDIEFEVFNEHFFCPILEEEVHIKKVLLRDKNCGDKLDKRIGGILILGENRTIEIEK